MDKAKMKSPEGFLVWQKLHGERRLGDILEDKTGLLQHR